jgi:putative DNA-invertase from lambdoid prophage Rac
MAVYGYTRVSTARQADEGESLEVQQRHIAGYTLQHGMEVTQTFVEAAVSGSVPLGDRPQGKAMLARLKRGDAIITPKLDRMFRSALDALGVLANLRERGISLHMLDLGGDVSSNGISKLVFTILSAVAEAERERTRERIADVKRDQRGRGHYLGGVVPFGWRRPDGWKRGDKGVELVPHAAEQAAIVQMRELADSGLSLRAIAADMSKQGHTLSYVGVSDVLRREAAAGQPAPNRVAT